MFINRFSCISFIFIANGIQVNLIQIIAEIFTTFSNNCLIFVNAFFSLSQSLFSLFHPIGQSIIDSRCYLDGGGSAESLTASEDLNVGSMIGK